VPVLDAAGEVIDDELSAPTYRIRRFRPCIEGTFARIERWTHKTTGDVHWRTISSDNVLTVFGKDGAHRIADPADRSRVFSWLLSETGRTEDFHAQRRVDGRPTPTPSSRRFGGGGNTANLSYRRRWRQ
jgi:hypothetical protein